MQVRSLLISKSWKTAFDHTREWAPVNEHLLNGLLSWGPGKCSRRCTAVDWKRGVYLFSFSWLHTFQLSRPFSAVGRVPLQSRWPEPPPAAPAPRGWAQGGLSWPLSPGGLNLPPQQCPLQSRQERSLPSDFCLYGRGAVSGAWGGAADTRCQCRPSHCSCWRNRRLAPTSSSCDYF